MATTGRVGPLRLDRSGRAAIVAFAGRPDADLRGRAPGGPVYEALGYGCRAKYRDGLAPTAGRGPYCRTVFYLNPRTHRLGTFFTASSRYVGPRGVRAGMPTAEAERRLGRRVFGGCEDNLYFGTKRTSLTVGFSGGRLGPHLHVIGGHVWALALHSRWNDVGVFDCL